MSPVRKIQPIQKLAAGRDRSRCAPTFKNCVKRVISHMRWDQFTIELSESDTVRPIIVDAKPTKIHFDSGSISLER
jgi:hypothetical protein